MGFWMFGVRFRSFALLTSKFSWFGGFSGFVAVFVRVQVFSSRSFDLLSSPVLFFSYSSFGFFQACQAFSNLSIFVISIRAIFSFIRSVLYR